MSILTSDVRLFLETKLSSKRWRLNNLYYIKNKNQKIVLFSTNKAQDKVLHTKALRKIILKARQLGVSTLYLLYALDDCLHVPNTDAGIQSYGQEEALKLMTRVKLAWELYPQELKELLKIDIESSNSSGIRFTNGSSLRIGNFRGDTLGILHVSELAKIAAKYPEKAIELQTGAFEAVGKDNIITIESTAEGKYGIFFDMWKRAERTPSEERTPLDFVPIFIGWYDDEDYSLDVYIEATEKEKEYFTKVEEFIGYNLSQEQKNWYTKKKQSLGTYMTREYPSFPDEAFMSNIEGLYYAHELSRIHFTKDEKYFMNKSKIHLSADLGMSDEFTFIFFQFDHKGNIAILDEFSDHGRGIQYYRDVIEAKAIYNGYDMSWKCVVPHDIKQREFSSGNSRLKAMKKAGFNPIIVPRMKVADGIQLVREALPRTTIRLNCRDVVSSIESYRKIYDDRYCVFLEKPFHDKHSHWADNLRYMNTAISLNLINNTIIDEYEVIRNSSYSV